MKFINELVIKLYKKQLKRNLYWWEPGGLPNIGDHLSKYIVEATLRLKDLELADKCEAKNKLLAIGSILHYAREKDCLWGTGRLGFISDEKMKFTNLDCRAVRGPKTRDYLLSRGIECPEIYGDPALLMPLFYKEELLTGNKASKEFIVIPHLADDMSLYEGYEDHMISPRMYPLEFAAKILEAKKVISSSLHGIIIAEAYGIPAVYVRGSKKDEDNDFKYHDYYLGTERKGYAFYDSIEEALKAEVAPIDKNVLSQIQKNLIKSFPYELWKRAN